MDQNTRQDLTPAQLLQYLPIYKVLVCTQCRYAVQPNGIPRHLKDIHHIYRSRRQPFMQHVSKFQLDHPQEVNRRKVHGFPVPSLPVENGLRCESQGCSYLCVSVKRMKHHWLSVHGRAGQSELDWCPVQLQTIFRGNFLKYFTRDNAVSLVQFQGVIKGKRGLYDEQDQRTTVVCDVHAVDGQQYNSKVLHSSLSLLDDFCSELKLDRIDEALLRHYTTYTYKTIAIDRESETLWRSTIPMLASKHPFLMHGILACSALHSCHNNPAQQYEQSLRSSSHQEGAMPLFRSAIANVNSGNCDAVLAFSHLLVIFSLASEKQDENLFLVEVNGPELLPSWLYFLRAGCSMLCSVWERLETGPVKALASAWELPIETSEECDLHLADYLISAIPSPTSQNAWSEDECQNYRHAAIELGRAFSHTRALGQSFTSWEALRIWPMRVSAEYMGMLGSWHPGALILLAHYCIILKQLESLWYLQGRAARLLTAVSYRLEPQWHCYIEWPLHQIQASHDCLVYAL